MIRGPLCAAAILILSGALASAAPVALSVRSWTNAAGTVPGVCDGTFAPEGAPPGREAAVMHGPEASLTLERKDARPAVAFSLQADGDRAFVVDWSRDAATWTDALDVPKSAGPGLRTRDVKLAAPVDARFVRIRPAPGDGRCAVSELRVYDALEGWPEPRAAAPAPDAPPAQRTATWLETIEPALAVLFLIAVLLASTRMLQPRDDLRPLAAALCAVVIALAAYGLAAQGRKDFLQYHRYVVYFGVLGATLALSAWTPRDGRYRALLAAVAALAVAGHYHFGKFHGDGYVHLHEFAHYYVGSKYFEEVGYDGLYRAYAAAGALEPEGRLRDLESREIVTAGADRERIDLVRKRFSDARWAEFRRDEAYFHGALGPEKWRAVLLDHGYNPSPAWTLWGRALGRAAAALGGDTAGAVRWLSLIDPVLVALMIALIALAFGRGAAAYALIFWAVNPWVLFDFTGGAFAREDWLFALIAALCLVQRGWPTAGGACLAFAAATRVFPALFALVPLVQLARTRDRARVRFAAGFAVGLGALLAASVAADGVVPWRAFLANGGKHNEGAYANHISLRAIVSFEPEHVTRTYAGQAREWFRHKQERFDAVRIGFVLLVVGLTALIVGAFRDATLAEAFAAGGFLPFVWFHPANYYCNYLLPVMLVAWARRGGGLRAAFAALLAGTCGFFFLSDYEVYNVYLSAVVLVWLGWTVADRLRNG
jgi:hypothetical protein